ncbi:MAG: DUF2071 domain-containing protein [Trueperaceae bacterium]|nr:DUF2071 domain-containing protein [Trueperaceae bacterium]
MIGRRHPAFARIDHRPWPVPTRPWAWHQSWRELLFVHWPVPAAALQPLVPRGLAVQEFEGTSWVGVVPFRMTGVMRRPFPDLPGISAFPELNVRIYVEAEGKPGVWFLSLDAANPLAVRAARRFLHLPYHDADIAFERTGDDLTFASQRRGAPERFQATYGPTGPDEEAETGTLEHWLTERYCLYAQAPDGRLLRNEAHHAPWPLRPAYANLEPTTLLAGFGIEPGPGRPHVRYADGVNVVVWDAEVVPVVP